MADDVRKAIGTDGPVIYADRFVVSTNGLITTVLFGRRVDAETDAYHQGIALMAHDTLELGHLLVRLVTPKAEEPPT